MITEQTRIIVLQLTDELLAQLRPFMQGLDITATPHSESAYQEVYEHGRFAGEEQRESGGIRSSGGIHSSNGGWGGR